MTLILTLDSHGTPVRWSNFGKAVKYKIKGKIMWELGDNNFILTSGRQKNSSDLLEVSIPSIIAVSGKTYYHKNRVPNLNSRNLFRRDLFMCAYCGVVLSESRLTKDHIIPKSKAGADSWTNCVTSCLRCNQKKANKTLQEARMELLYVPYTPDRAENLILQNRNILADQMEFLMPHLPKYSRAKDLLPLIRH